jgi:serine/threonine protein kinase
VEETIFALRALESAIVKTAASKSGSSPAASTAVFATPAGAAAGDLLPAAESQQIREAEVLLLVECGFDVVVKHPHRLFVEIAARSQAPADFIEAGLLFLNVALLTSLSFYEPPAQVGAALLFASACHPAFSLPQAECQQLHALLHPGTPPDPDPATPARLDVWAAPYAQLLGVLPEPLLSHFHLQLPAFLRLVQPAPPPPPPVLHAACRLIDSFQILDTINEGTYGTVYKALDKQRQQVVALKQLKRTTSRSGFPYYMLREILYLVRLRHDHIIRGRDIACRLPTGQAEAEFFISMDFVPHDLLSVFKLQLKAPTTDCRFSVGQAKHCLLQVLEALSYMHSLNLLHRDIKLANLLITDEGVIKVADLGSIRDSGRQSLKLTTQVVTLWYRSPELLLGTPTYTSAIDIWSIGCLFVELFTYSPLFPGASDKDMLGRILRLKGAPPGEVWNDCYQALPGAPHFRPFLKMYPDPKSLSPRVPGLSPAGLALLERMLDWDPRQRIDAATALRDPFFTEPPLPTPPIVRLKSEPTMPVQAFADMSLSSHTPEDLFDSDADTP